MLNILCLTLGVLNPIFSTGSNALLINPANLGLTENPIFSCEIVDLNAGFANNAFNIVQYNRYSGAFIDETAKKLLLRSVPKSGLAMNTGFNGAMPQFSYRNFAVSVRSDAGAEVVVPKDLIDLILNGNELDRMYSSNGARAKFTALLRSGIGTGKRWGNFLVGASFNYIRGLFYSQLLNHEARIVTTREGFTGEGCVGYLKAQGGNGWSIDVGGAYQKARLYLGLAVFDLSPGIVWHEQVEERYLTFKVDSANLYELFAGSDKIYSRVNRVSSNDVLTYLPIKLNMSIGYQIKPGVNAGVVLRPVLELEPFGLNRLSAELISEVTIKKLVPICLTVGYDNRFGVITGINTGLNLKGWNFLLGVKEVGGLLFFGKGAEVRLAIGYAAFPRAAVPKSVIKI